MKKTYIGIDNGVSGSIGIIYGDGSSEFHPTPIKKELNYTKSKKYINRLDVPSFKRILESTIVKSTGSPGIMVVLERPMVNPLRFDATISAIRCLEATLIVIEELNLSFNYIDSKVWQKELLPSGLKGTDELKKASLDIGSRLFSQFKDVYKNDADGILIAEYARRKEL